MTDTPERGLLRRLWRQLSRRRKAQFFLVLGTMLLGAFAEVLSLGAILPFLAVLADPARLTHIPGVDTLIASLGLGNDPRTLLVVLTAVFAVASLFAGIIRVVLSWVSNKYVFALGHDFGTRLYERVLYQPYRWHVERNTSEVISGVQKVQSVTNGMLLPLMQAASSALIGLFIVAALLVVSPLISGVAFVSFGLMYVAISFLTRRRLKGTSKVTARSQKERIQAVQEGLGGIRDVLLDGSQKVFLKRFSRVDAQLREAQAVSTLIGSTPRYMIEATGMVLIALLALWVTQGQGGMSGGLPILGALALGAQRLLPLMQVVYNGWTRVGANAHVLDDIVTTLEMPLPATWSAASEQGIAFTREIACRHLGFRYAPDPPPVLSDVTFSVPKGARIGIVGKTGSGKSTLVDLLMGLLEASEGTIEIDGRTLDDHTRRAWQRQIAHVPQAIFLADASIAENIAFGIDERHVDLQRVHAAAEQAEIADFIETLPQGYDTMVGERGMRLSGGQRQRIGIARALYKQAQVLVFDEATSALDTATESAVMDSIGRLSEDLTIFIVAHRLSTLERCDALIVIEKGGARLQPQAGSPISAA